MCSHFPNTFSRGTVQKFRGTPFKNPWSKRTTKRRPQLKAVTLWHRSTQTLDSKLPREEQNGRTVLMCKDIATSGPGDGRRPMCTKLSTGWASFLSLTVMALRQPKLYSWLAPDRTATDASPLGPSAQLWGLTPNYVYDRSWFDKNWVDRRPNYWSDTTANYFKSKTLSTRNELTVPLVTCFFTGWANVTVCIESVSSIYSELKDAVRSTHFKECPMTQCSRSVPFNQKPGHCVDATQSRWAPCVCLQSKCHTEFLWERIKCAAAISTDISHHCSRGQEPPTTPRGTLSPSQDQLCQPVANTVLGAATCGTAPSSECHTTLYDTWYDYDIWYDDIYTVKPV
jgi:hypothetical protein